MVKEVVKGANGQPLKVPQKETGYLYFVDGDGSVMRAKMEKGKALSPEEIRRRAKVKAENKDKREKRIAANKAKKLAAIEETEKRAATRAAESKAKKLAAIEAQDKRAKEQAKKREEKKKELGA